VADIRVPDSDAARAAERLSREQSPQTLYAHAVRSFLFASLLARRDRQLVDEEALYVGCILHDIGLTPRHKHPSRAFEYVSADVAMELSETFDWPERRRSDLGRAIILHMAEEVAASETAEARLLEAGVALDVTGHRLADVDSFALREILRRLPRGPFKNEFSALMREEAEGKPGCAAAALIDRGLIGRIAAAPFPDTRPSAYTVR
jgi:HD superfamily phosphodiesterase